MFRLGGRVCLAPGAPALNLIVVPVLYLSARSEGVSAKA